MAVNKVLQACAKAETKVGPIRSSAGIELMRKAQTAGDVGPQLMLGSEKREKVAKLELVDIRMISLRKGGVRGLLFAIGRGVAVPHKFELGIGGKGIIEEGSKAQVGIGGKLGNCDGYRRGGHGEGPVRLITCKRRDFPFMFPPLRICRGSHSERSNSCQRQDKQATHSSSFSRDPLARQGIRLRVRFLRCVKKEKGMPDSFA